MFRLQLVPGDLINVFTWFGSITMEICLVEGKEQAHSMNKDIIIPIDKLHFKSKVVSGHSRWSYLGKSKKAQGEYIEYEEVADVAICEKRKSINLTQFHIKTP